jgi:hypothetical protein
VTHRAVRALLEDGAAWRDAERRGEPEGDARNGRSAGARGALLDPCGAAIEPERARGDAVDAEPIRKAADALARLDAALTGRAVDARDGEVAPKRRA